MRQRVSDRVSLKSLKAIALGHGSDRATAVFLIGASGFIYFACLVLGQRLGRMPVTSSWNHYVLLAEAFLHGQLGLIQNDALHLMKILPYNEIVQYNSQYFVVYPPMPAVILMPLVAMFGTGVHTNLVSISVAALTVGVAYTMLRRLEFTQSVSYWTAVLFSLGTNFWYTCLNGSPWYFAHIVCCLFFFLAIAEIYGSGRAWLAGLFMGAAVLARLPVVTATPVLMAMIALQRAGWRTRALEAAQLAAPVCLFVGLNMAYNYLRYGTVANRGYDLIPGVLQVPWNADGILGIGYLPRNIYAVLFQSPVLVDHFPYFVPSTFGTNLFVTTPAFLLAFLAPANKRLTWLVLVGAVASMSADLLHGWPGGEQFGYRFALDAAPFLLILVALGLREQVSRRAKALIGLSILCSVWGLLYATWVPVQWIFPLPQ